MEAAAAAVSSVDEASMQKLRELANIGGRPTAPRHLLAAAAACALAVAAALLAH